MVLQVGDSMTVSEGSKGGRTQITFNVAFCDTIFKPLLRLDVCVYSVYTDFDEGLSLNTYVCVCVYFFVGVCKVGY